MSEEEVSFQVDSGFIYLTGYILAFITPFILLFVQQVLGGAVLLEEGVKLGIVYNISRQIGVEKISMVHVMGIGLVFALSETVLYVMNAFLSRTPDILLTRVFVTVPMHVIVLLVAFSIGRMGKVWWIVGLLASVAMHSAFNSLVG